MDRSQLFAPAIIKTHFQPIVGLHSRSVYGFEALTRALVDEQLVPPIQLFDRAAELDCGVEFDDFCLQLAVARFVKRSLPGRLFVNVRAGEGIDWGKRARRLRALLREVELSPTALVVEITESERIVDDEGLIEASQQLRQTGVAMAMDDVGAGYSGLSRWERLRPDYVKIDKHFARDIESSGAKREFVRLFNNMSRRTGALAIAEGIETLDELATITALGVPLGQGFLFARPSEQPDLDPQEALAGHFDPGHHISPEDPLRSLLRNPPVVGPDQYAEEVLEYFLADEQLSHIPVVQDDHALGMVWRDAFMNTFASRYGLALNARRPVRELMSDDALMIDVHTSLERASRMITETRSQSVRQACLLLDGKRYLGVITFIDLLREITDLRLEKARHANALTGLPGNVPIEEEMERRLQQGQAMVAAYLDLDNFKPFNDRYGHERGDQMLRGAAQMMRDYLLDAGDFLGHVGGDDFIVLFRQDSAQQGNPWQRRVDRLLDAFTRFVPGFYDQQDRKAECIESFDREGNRRRYGFVSLSIAVHEVAARSGIRRDELASSLARTKKLAKQQLGNSVVAAAPASDHA